MEKATNYFQLKKVRTDHVRQLVITNIQVAQTLKVESRLTSTHQSNMKYQTTHRLLICLNCKSLVTLMNSETIWSRLKKDVKLRNQPFVNTNTRIVQRKNMVLQLTSTHQSNMKCQTMHQLLKSLNYKSLAMWTNSAMI